MEVQQRVPQQPTSEAKPEMNPGHAIDWTSMPLSWFAQEVEGAFVPFMWEMVVMGGSHQVQVSNMVACWVDPTEGWLGRFKVRQLTIAQLWTSSSSASLGPSISKLAKVLCALASFFRDGSSDTKELTSQGPP